MKKRKSIFFKEKWNDIKIICPILYYKHFDPSHFEAKQIRLKIKDTTVPQRFLGFYRSEHELIRPIVKFETGNFK